MSRLPALLLLPALALSAACTAGAAPQAGQDSRQDGRQDSREDDRQDAAGSDGRAAQPAAPTGVTRVAGQGGAALAAATSAALYERAPVVVVAPAGDLPEQARAASAAVALGAPLLLAVEGSAVLPVLEELERLRPQAVLAFGPAVLHWSRLLEQTDLDLDLDDDVVPAPAEPEALAALLGERLGAPQQAVAAGLRSAVGALPVDGPVPLLQLPGAAPSTTPGADSAALPELAAPRRAEGLVVLASGLVPDALAPVATARAAGAEVHVLRVADPRADSEVVQALADSGDAPVVALGDAFGTQEQLQSTVASARTGVELPAGGQLVLPGKLYVALYGHPGSRALGVLGEQGVEATVRRAKQVAAEYEAAGSTVPVVPTFEIITTVASAALGDGDYSDEASIEHVKPLVDAAGREGVYVVLDLQPGYDDFLTQAKMYEPLLKLPHVGLALDPEWRLKPGERHLRQIGRVGADEVNSVVTWLADLTRDNALPQKMLLLHQFKTFMLEDRERIDAGRPEVTVVTQMDGHGSPGTKLETWGIIRPGAPEGMRFGWKNFYDEDTPTMSPARTLAVEPTPVFVSYQ